MVHCNPPSPVAVKERVENETKSSLLRKHYNAFENYAPLFCVIFGHLCDKKETLVASDL